MNKTRVAELSDEEAIGLFREDPIKNFDVLRNRRVRSDVDLTLNEKIITLPEGFIVDGDLYLHGCMSLASLPEGLRVSGNLTLTDCRSLASLPEGLTVGNWLSLVYCKSLTSLPENFRVGGEVWLYNCIKLKVWLVKERKIEWLKRKVKGQIKGLLE